MQRQRAFTLVEMLVVIGIIVLLIGILATILNIAYTHSIRNRMQLDLQSITLALEAYKGDMRQYPTLDYNDTGGIMTAAYPGSVLLSRCLLAPGNATEDGAGTNDATGKETLPGLGFRMVIGGQIYGPYLEASRFKMATDPVLAGDANNMFLADRYGHPILYFKANSGANVNAANGYVASWTSASGGSAPRYNIADNPGSSSPLAAALTWYGTDNSTTNGLNRMRLELGDLNANGMIDNGETAVNLPFLLWGAGPDEVFGVDAAKGTAIAAGYVPSNDDATNFVNLK